MKEWDTYPCDEFKYETASILRRHKGSKHDHLRYSCDECEYAAKTAWNLNCHKESKHEWVQYPCDESEYAANQAGGVLKLHQKVKP